MRKSLNFENIDKFADMIEELVDCGEDIAVIGRYQFILDLMNYLTKNTDLELFSVRIDHPAIEHYQDAWIMSIDEERKIWCQKAICEGYMVDEWAQIDFVEAEAGEKVVNHYDSAYVVTIGEEPEKEPEEEPAELSENEHGIHFSKTMPNGSTWSVSLYSSDPELISSAAEIFNKIQKRS